MPERDFSDNKKEFTDNSDVFCFLNIYKPRGITSFDVIYKLRKHLKIKKIGHSGTLDPEAEGVMQVGVGKATRLLDYLCSDKRYIAKIRFGYFSSTGDAEGEVTPFNTPKFTEDELLVAMNSMIGKIEQIPPAYSAIKVGGKKLCDLARKNKLEGVEIPKRVIEIYDAKLLTFVTDSHPDIPMKQIPYEAEIEIFCSKGTYIRSFAVDLAEKLGTCAYLTSLIRTAAGKFNIKDSIQTDAVLLDKHGVEPSKALNLPEYILNESEYLKVLNGVAFLSRYTISENTTLMLIYKNHLVSIAVLSDNMIVCKKVFKQHV